MPRSKANKVALSFYVDKALAKELQHYSVDAECSLSALLEEVVKTWWINRTPAQPTTTLESTAPLGGRLRHWLQNQNQPESPGLCLTPLFKTTAESLVVEINQTANRSQGADHDEFSITFKGR